MQSTQEMVEGWIRSAASEALLPHLLLPAEESAQIVEALQKRYVLGDPRAWWLGFKVPCSRHNSKEVNLSTMLPDLSALVYLIPESGMNHPQVYKFQAGDLELLIDNCPYFEYSVAALDGSWLLTESDHDVFFFCKS